MNLFDPAAYVRDVEAAARTDGWSIRYLSPCPSSTRPWLQRTSRSGLGAPRLYLSTGIHGDEIAGPLAVLEMLQQPDFFTDFEVTVFPILNPEGLARGLRTNAEGIDLNRDYRESKSAEIQSHLEALKSLGRFDGAILLHEDFEGVGAYLYELNDRLKPGLGLKMLAAMAPYVPIDLRPEIEEIVALGGVIQRSDIILKNGPIEDRPDWPEATYLSVHHTNLSYTTETPLPFPLQQRIAAQIAAVRTLMAALKTESSTGSAGQPS